MPFFFFLKMGLKKKNNYFLFLIFNQINVISRARQNRWRAKIGPRAPICRPLPYGVFTARAGIVPHLPVPLLIGRDYKIFHRLWNPERENRARREPSRRGGRTAWPAYGATRIPATQEESSAEDQGSEGNGPSPPGSPAHAEGGSARAGSQGRRPDTSDTLTAPERNDPPEGSESSPLTEFSDFLPMGGEGTTRPGQFASARRPKTCLEPCTRP